VLESEVCSNTATEANLVERNRMPLSIYLFNGRHGGNEILRGRVGEEDDE
jgi:sRNA-binding regulator protein Hfq